MSIFKKRDIMGIYTIGFTKKTAETFFNILIDNNIDVLLDIRLNNTSQLASFAKYPDIEYFLRKLVKCNYIHDLKFSPEEKTLKAYKAKDIKWDTYVEQFQNTMKERKITEYINEKYMQYDGKNICLLCSEASYKECHRSIVSVYFKEAFNANVIHL